MKLLSVKQTIFGLGLLVFASIASAQYVWVDEKGSKQFSDMPPPASVPKNRILKQPGSMLRPASQADGEAAGSSDTAAAKAPLTLAEKNAEFQKRRAEQAEKEKKAAEEAKQAADKAKNCERARNYQRALESGQRLAKANANGEREFMSDEQRSQEIRESNRILAECR